MKHGLTERQIDRDGYYTLWQKVGGHWVVERSFPGRYILDTMMDAIESSWVSSRPYGVFPHGTDPNLRENPRKAKNKLTTRERERSKGRKWMRGLSNRDRWDFLDHNVLGGFQWEDWEDFHSQPTAAFLNAAFDEAQTLEMQRTGELEGFTGAVENPPYSGYRKRWTQKKLPKNLYKACYTTKTDALNVFLTFNSDVVEDYGGPSYVHSPESFEAINHLYEIRGKRRVDSIAKAVWWALAGPGPWCLEDIDLGLLNQTAPVIYNEYGYEFRLPDHLEEARLIAEETEWYEGVEYPEHEEVPF